MKTIPHKIELIHASPKDLMELDFIRENKQKVFKLCNGIPFWLKNSKGVIEMKHNTTSDATNLEDLKELFKQKRVFIQKPI